MMGLVHLSEKEEAPEFILSLPTCTHTRKRPCEDTERRWLSASQKWKLNVPVP